MPYENLSDFLSDLQDDGELRRIAPEVDPVLEISEICDRVGKQPGGGPALLFERVRGSNLPLVTNLLGSQKRMCRALGIRSFQELTQRIATFLRPDVPENWLDKLKLVPRANQSQQFPPQLIKTGVCQQVVKVGRDVDLGELPALQYWPGESGRILTLGQIHSRRPESGQRHVEMFPLEIRDRNSLAVHWHPHHEAFQTFVEHKSRGTQMPLAVAFGGDPILAFSATAPLPPFVDPLVFGGFLRGKSIEFVKCRQIELEAPAHAEVVLEGYLDPTEPLDNAGPFGRPTGFYSLPEVAPTLHVTAVTHRGNPIFVASVAGKPPAEVYWFEQARECLLLPLVQLSAPEVVDIHHPRAGAWNNFCFVSIRKRFPQQARKVMQALWGLHWTMFSKFIVVVDEHVNVRDPEQVWFYAGANVHPGRDVLFSEGPTAGADHAAPVRGVGHKMGIDATKKFADEGHSRPWPLELEMSPEMKELVTRRWPDYRIDIS